MNTHPPGTGPTATAGASNLVAARGRDGSVVKGHTRDFLPDGTLFHVLPRGAAQSVPVLMEELKAVFFVRDLIGNKLHDKNRMFPPFDASPDLGRRIAVVFEDGELLIGHARTYSGEGPGFFVFPLDPRGNNTSIYVLRAATREVRLGLGAEELARSTPPVPHATDARRRRILGER